jgi:hypothetical protein
MDNFEFLEARAIGPAQYHKWDMSEEMFKEFMDAWGLDAQLNMAQEEAGELVVAVGQWKRGRVEEWNVIEEAVDTFFMALELRSLNPEIFDQIFEFKKQRTLKRLAKWKEENESN